eukprot:scaffold239813_cov29-Attheya_sp.AAC.1
MPFTVSRGLGFERDEYELVVGLDNVNNYLRKRSGGNVLRTRGWFEYPGIDVRYLGMLVFFGGADVVNDWPIAEFIV